MEHKYMVLKKKKKQTPLMQNVSVYMKSYNSWDEVDIWLQIYVLTSIAHGHKHYAIRYIFTVPSD